MKIISLLPHFYALFIALMYRWEIDALRKNLKELRGESRPSDDWIEYAVRESVLSDIVKAPLLAILPTIVTALLADAPLLAAISVFLLLLTWQIFFILKQRWEPWHLSREYKLQRWTIKGDSLITLGKIAVILISIVVVLLT